MNELRSHQRQPLILNPKISFDSKGEYPLVANIGNHKRQRFSKTASEKSELEQEFNPLLNQQ
jgi:hypothetical protein